MIERVFSLYVYVAIDKRTHCGDIVGAMKLNEYLKQPDSQDEETFAAEVGVSVSSVRKWRYGDRFPRQHHHAKITAATGGKVTPNDFFPDLEVV